MSQEQGLRATLVREQLQALLGHVRRAGESLTPQDRLRLSKATALLTGASRLEEGLPQEISVLRNVTSLEDALALITEEAEEAEEA